MTPERIDALRRQRALVAEHLAWLDAELAGVQNPASDPSSAPAPEISQAPVSTPPSAQSTTPSPQSSPPALDDPVPSPAEEDRLAAANARANAILEQYAATDRFNPEATKRGCMLAAIAALLFGVTGLMVIYLVRYR